VARNAPAWSLTSRLESRPESMSSKDVRKTKPRALLVYYNHTQQAKKVSDAMAEVLRGRGCDVTPRS